MGRKDEKQVAELCCEEGTQPTEKYCHKSVLGKMGQLRNNKNQKKMNT